MGPRLQRALLLGAGLLSRAAGALEDASALVQRPQGESRAVEAPNKDLSQFNVSRWNSFDNKTKSAIMAYFESKKQPAQAAPALKAPAPMQKANATKEAAPALKTTMPQQKANSTKQAATVLKTSTPKQKESSTKEATPALRTTMPQQKESTKEATPALKTTMPQQKESTKEATPALKTTMPQQKESTKEADAADAHQDFIVKAEAKAGAKLERRAAASAGVETDEEEAAQEAAPAAKAGALELKDGSTVEHKEKTAQEAAPAAKAGALELKESSAAERREKTAQEAGSNATRELESAGASILARAENASRPQGEEPAAGAAGGAGGGQNDSALLRWGSEASSANNKTANLLAPQNIKAGEDMEVVALQGPQAGQWLRCKIIGMGKDPDTFDVFIPGVPKEQRRVNDIPAWGLRRPAPVEIAKKADKKDGLLFFWAVSGKDKALKLVTENIDHLRKTYKGRADVFLVHYDGQKTSWVMKNATWYNKNVQYASESFVAKRYYASASMLFATEFYPLHVRFARRVLPEILAKRAYEYVWLLDEDVDFRATDLNRMVEDARRSEAAILAPSALFVDSERKRATEKLYFPGCGQLQATCFVHVPKPACQYRYVNFIGAYFPIMKPEVLTELAACPACDSQIDRLWCRRAARQLQLKPETACAVLDQVNIVHTNGKTLRKWEAVDASHNLIQDVSTAFTEDFVDQGDIADLECVRAPEDQVP